MEKSPHPSPLITPNLRTASYLGIEDAIELRTGGDTTLQGDDIITIGRFLSHHLLYRLKADFTEPDAMKITMKKSKATSTNRPTTSNNWVEMKGQ